MAVRPLVVEHLWHESLSSSCCCGSHLLVTAAETAATAAFMLSDACASKAKFNCMIYLRCLRLAFFDFL